MNGERFTYKNSKPPWSSKIQNLHDYVSSQSSRAFRGVNPEIRRQDEVEVLELPFCWGKDLSSTQSAVPQERKPGEAVVMWQFCVWNYCWWKKSGEAPGTKRTMYIMGHVHNFTYIYILYRFTLPTSAGCRISFINSIKFCLQHFFFRSNGVWWFGWCMSKKTVEHFQALRKLICSVHGMRCQGSHFDTWWTWQNYAPYWKTIQNVQG